MAVSPCPALSGSLATSRAPGHRGIRYNDSFALPYLMPPRGPVMYRQTLRLLTVLCLLGAAPVFTAQVSAGSGSLTSTGRHDRPVPAAFVRRPAFRPSRPAAMAGQSRPQGLRRLPQQALSASRRPAPPAPAPHPARRLLASGPSRLRTSGAVSSRTPP